MRGRQAPQGAWRKGRGGGAGLVRAGSLWSALPFISPGWAHPLRCQFCAVLCSAHWDAVCVGYLLLLDRVLKSCTGKGPHPSLTSELQADEVGALRPCPCGPHLAVDELL